jgi:sugar/nucleoside kinase (ribokinase family)
MRSDVVDVVVAGHICLDIIPDLSGVGGRSEDLVAPGKLVRIGPATVATGGAVSNTGLALHRLGTATHLMGKVGDDAIGGVIVDIVRRHGPHLAEGMIVAAGEASSYTVVISPPGIDRTFLHCPGANDTFTDTDVPYDRLGSARLFHFGYPTLMHRMYADGGDALTRMLRRVREQGVAVSLDMSYPDPLSPAGRADWPSILRKALPHVDIFLPSLDEMRFMLRGAATIGDASPSAPADGALLGRLAQTLLDMGVAVVGLKLGAEGLYLRTTRDAARLKAVGGKVIAEAKAWAGHELLAPCFEVRVAGTTGSGDCTIAGMLAAMLHGLSPEAAMRAAVGVGACSVEQPDATSGVPDWATVERRLAAAWRQRPVTLALPDWTRDAATGLFRGPWDQGGRT